MVSHSRIGSRNDRVRVPKSALAGYGRGIDVLFRNLAHPFATRQSVGYGHAGGSGWELRMPDDCDMRVFRGLSTLRAAGVKPWLNGLRTRIAGKPWQERLDRRNELS